MEPKDYISLNLHSKIAVIVNQYFYLNLNRSHRGNLYHGGLYLHPQLTYSVDRILLYSFDEKANNYQEALFKINQWAKKQKVPLFFQNILNIPEEALQFIRPLKQPYIQKVKNLNYQHIKE